MGNHFCKTLTPYWLFPVPHAVELVQSGAILHRLFALKQDYSGINLSFGVKTAGHCR